MRKKTYPPQEVSNKLKDAEALLARGHSLAEAADRIGVKYGTLYQWRRRFADSDVDVIIRIKRLEAENARLRKALDELEAPEPTFRRAIAGLV